MNHDIKERQPSAALYDFCGKPSFVQAAPLAMQHVVAMIVGCITPAIIVANAAGLGERDRIILVQAALVMSSIPPAPSVPALGEPPGGAAAAACAGYHDLYGCINFRSAWV